MGARVSSLWALTTLAALLPGVSPRGRSGSPCRPSVLSMLSVASAVNPPCPQLEWSTPASAEARASARPQDRDEQVGAPSLATWAISWALSRISANFQRVSARRIHQVSATRRGDRRT